MQNEITTPSPLHNPDGTLAQCGWARDLLLVYDRRRIRAGKWRIKEWDYYCVLAETHGITLTVADNGYMGFVAVNLLDLVAPGVLSHTVITPFPLGSFRMPATSHSGDIKFQHKELSINFLQRPGERILEVECPSFAEGKALRGSLCLRQPSFLESMTIITPFAGKKKAFYYNQKINCLAADGKIEFGAEKLAFDPVSSSGVLDWGRGVWTYANTWYWASCSSRLEGELFGFNLGYGFGDTSAASENILFYKGRAHKLDQVLFHNPPQSYLDPWDFTSNDGRLEMAFEPVFDRHCDTNLLLIRSNQHQVFGRFSGSAVLDNGEKLVFRNLTGFAEKVYNRW